MLLKLGDDYADRVCDRLRAEIKNEPDSTLWDAALRTAILICWQEYKPTSESKVEDGNK
jgi:hypothetical protein